MLVKQATSYLQTSSPKRSTGRSCSRLHPALASLTTQQSHSKSCLRYIGVYHVKNQKVDLRWVQHPSPTYAYKKKVRRTPAPPVTASQNLEDFCSGPPPGTSSQHQNLANRGRGEVAVGPGA
ncbi:hypothetical protein HZ326_12809 [Fusarium oxysporum f. sp. albedinis]|nr:hypothetical protein HZ326_12809 [Fusarium oxysporum f. sp. albedinis]